MISSKFLEKGTLVSDAFVWSKPEEIVAIGGSEMYCLTHRARDEVLARLRELGYRVDDLADGDDSSDDAARLKAITESRGARYYAHLDISTGKCGSCQQYISTTGIRSHGHTCEKCGAITSQEIVDGSTVIFSFRDDGPTEFWGPELQLTTKRWKDNHIWCYTSGMRGKRGLGSHEMTPGEIEEYLAKHHDKWRYETIDDEQFLVVFYEFRPRLTYPNQLIVMKDIWGGVSNYSIVRVYEGKEYSEYRQLPVPDSLHIYDTQDWERLQPSPDLHERLFTAVRQVSDCDYYYQDGRDAFSPEMFERMGLYVKHFTTLDYEAWRRLIPRIPLDGPGAIMTIARFCHPQPRVQNAPNIGNVLVALGELASSQPRVDAKLRRP